MLLQNRSMPREFCFLKTPAGKDVALMWRYKPHTAAAAVLYATKPAYRLDRSPSPLSHTFACNNTA